MKRATADRALPTTRDYRQFIEDLKARIVSARLSVARAINRDLILLYWDIGRAIVEKQAAHGWGDSVVEVVAADLRTAFPDSISFSADNVWRMRQFYLAYASSAFLGQVVPEAERTVARGKRSAILEQPVPETEPTGNDVTTAVSDLELLARVPWGSTWSS